MLRLPSQHAPGVVNWIGTFLVGVGETLGLLYLMLASGNL